jgi:hypothetical protein
MNPYVILAGISFFVLSTAGTYIAGRRDGQRIELSGCLAKAAAVQEASMAQAAAIQEAAQIASNAAAEAIAGIKVENTTIRQKVEKEIHTIPADCAVPDSVLDLTNQALTGQEPSDSGVPGSNADGVGDVP